MGSNQPHHLLIAVPWPEPAEALDELRKKHPQFKVTYIHLTNPNPMSGEHNIPDGNATWNYYNYTDLTYLATR